MKNQYYFYTLDPKLIFIPYKENDKIFKPWFIHRLAKVTDFRVILIKQSDKDTLLETMTYMTGRRMNKKRILDGILMSSQILNNTVVYSWGSAYKGKLGLGKLQRLEESPDFQISCPTNFNKQFLEMANPSSHGKKLLTENAYKKNLYTYVPQVIMNLWGKEFKSIKCGLNHSVALTKNGDKLYVWGDNSYSQLGMQLDKASPKPKESSQSASSLAILQQRDRIGSPVSGSGLKILSSDEQKFKTYAAIPKLHPKFSNSDTNHISLNDQDVSFFSKMPFNMNFYRRMPCQITMKVILNKLQDNQF